MSSKETLTLSGVEHQKLGVTGVVINILLTKLPFGIIGHFPGFKVLEEAKCRPAGEECTRFIFGVEDPTQELLFFSARFVRQEEPRPDDLAVYCDKGRFRHIGKVASDGKHIISKWGSSGPVIQHPPHAVPHVYGCLLGYFRPKDCV